MAHSIKFQRQGICECLLASIAMLADVPIADVRERALSLANAHLVPRAVRQWSETAAQPVVFWLVIDTLIAEYRLAGLAPLGAQCNRPPGKSTAGLCIPHRGRGQLVIQFPHSLHAAVYADGCVYDPESEGPVSIAGYMAFLVRESGTIISVLPVEPLRYRLVRRLLNWLGCR